MSATTKRHARFELNPDEPMMTPNEVLKALNLPSIETVYWLRSSGKLKAVRIGKYIRFYRRDVEELLARENPELLSS
jgi:excisionase family DNA binding protein